MRWKNSETRYGVIAILFHWIMAVLLIGLLVLGWYMVQLPIGLDKLKAYGWHKEYGLLALWLVILRLAWRITNITPHLTLPRWEVIAARSVHWLFYIIMFAMPITGWLLTSAAGLNASFFGLFVLPNLVAPSDTLLELFEEIHEALGYTLAAIIILHISAALKHHFINKDDILRRMIS